MLEALGLDESGLDKVIKKSYDLLGLMSFLTAGEPEVRAWTIKKGTKAPEAAGKIQTAMIISAALIEGVCLFAVVVALIG